MNRERISTLSADPAAGGCFDVRLARHPVRIVPLERVVDLLHVTHLPQVVAEYRAAMRRGERFPPISVVRVGRRFYVADGHKRLAAFAGLGRDTLPVEVWPVRRLLRDQFDQFREKVQRTRRVLASDRRDPEARAAAIRFRNDIFSHWRRIFRSLRTLRRGAG